MWVYGGVILIAGLGILANYTSYVLRQFKITYPYMHNMAGAGEVMRGPIGREGLRGRTLAVRRLRYGLAYPAFGVVMKTVTSHTACTIVFGAMRLLVSVVFCLSRTLHKASYLSIAKHKRNLYVARYNAGSAI